MDNSLKQLGELFKRERVERFIPRLGYDGLQGHDNEPSVMEETPKPPIGEIGNKKFGWLESLADRSIPSEEYFKQTALLAQIVDSLDKLRATSTVADFTHVHRYTVPASATDYIINVRDIAPYGYLYIPALVETPGLAGTFNFMSIYLGLGPNGFPLCNNEASDGYRTINLADIDTITIKLNNTIAAERVFQFAVSTRKIGLERVT